jgi:hypothetical protein
MNNVLRPLGAAASLVFCVGLDRPAFAEGQALPHLRLPFIANEGQVARQVAYYATTSAGTVFVTARGELVYRVHGDGVGADRERCRESSITERPVGGTARPVGRDRTGTRVAYFLGRDSARWRSGVRTYEQVDLGEVWPGVTVTLRARERDVEKVFTVRPGGSVERIRIRVGGAHALGLDGEGAVTARTASGRVTFTAPVAYQERGGVRQAVTVAYRQRGREYGFTVGAYDHSRPLIIDPILQSTFLGGGAADGAQALAIAPGSGDVYVAGNTQSIDFPGTAGGAQPTLAGSLDGFVARLSSDLTTLLGVTYLGGSAGDAASGLAISPATGEVYVVGITDSRDFPGTAGGAQPTFGGGGADAFVARLSRDLTTLIQATYLGGSALDVANALAIAPGTGNVYVAGSTVSTNFPGTTGGAQPTYGGGVQDAFLAVLPSSLTTLIQATYLGGPESDDAKVLPIAPDTGDVYVAGETWSHGFPRASGGVQPLKASGFNDAFVARLSSGLTELQQATYLGGSQDDEATALAIAPGTGDVYVAGRTNSVDFPRTSGGALPFGGFSDAFVARFPRDLTALTQATYLGSTRYENAWALAIAPATGDVYVAGATDSPDFPAARGGAQPVGGMAQAFGVADAFVSRLTPSLAPVDTPSLTARISINQPTFGTAQTLSTSMSLDNPGGAGAADLYLGGLLPDGVTIVFWTGAGNFAVGSLADIRTFRPYATGVSLSTPFSRDMPGWVSHVWAPDDPRGRYIVFNLATKAGALAGGILTRDEILALATASFFLR